MLSEMTALSEAIRIDGIYTVLKVDYREKNGFGEAHDFPELVYISEGSVVSIRDGVDRVGQAGQLTLIAPGVFHKKKAPAACEGWIISFVCHSPLLQGLYNQTMDLDAAEREEMAFIFSLGLRCFERRPQGGMGLSPEADVYLLEIFKKRLELFLLGLHRRYGKDRTEERKKETAEQKRICILLSERIEQNLSVEEIARLADVSVSKLKGIFREKGGVLHAFIRMKIERAQRMIRAGQMNFSEIADALGFASLHYFSRTFKTVTGVSPSQFKHLL